MIYGIHFHTCSAQCAVYWLLIIVIKVHGFFAFTYLQTGHQQVVKGRLFSTHYIFPNLFFFVCLFQCCGDKSGRYLGATLFYKHDHKLYSLRSFQSTKITSGSKMKFQCCQCIFFYSKLSQVVETL